MIPVFRRLYEACMENDLPIGLAPNIHVSLVMLPEECRSLSRRRFPWQSVKLAAMKRLVRRRHELFHIRVAVGCGGAGQRVTQPSIPGDLTRHGQSSK